MCKFLDFMDSPSYTLKKWPLCINNKHLHVSVYYHASVVSRENHNRIQHSSVLEEWGEGGIFGLALSLETVWRLCE